ncbi:MAG: hypothetical protein AAF432_07375 [Planctomycetota bacterium]
MDEIRALLRQTARRLETNRLLRIVHWVVLVAAGVVLSLGLINRTPAEPIVPWVWVLPIVAFIALVVILVVWMRSRFTERHVAVEVDERLDLDERLSTALQLEQSNDPFARAAVDDAVQVARDPRNQEKAKRFFAIKAPAGWWCAPLVILLALMAQRIPQLNLFERDAAPPQSEVSQVAARVEQTVNSLVEAIEENEALKNELAGLDDANTKASEPAEPDPLRSPEEIRRDAIKKVTDLKRKLNDILDGEKAKTMEALDEALKGMELPDRTSESRALAEALARGDFENAAKAAQDMVNQMANGEMSPEQQEKVAKQLEDIAQQLQNMAQQQQALKDALEQAGLDPQLADNPEALKQELENNQNLNEQQKQQLQQQQQAQQQAQQMCEGLGQAMQQMAQGMQNGQQGQAGQAGQQMQQQLNDMEQLDQMLKQAQAAMNQCQGGAQDLGQGLGLGQQGQPGQGQGQQGQGQGQMAGMQGGMGQQGQGQGGRAPVAPTPTKTVLQKTDVETDPTGDIIAKQFFQSDEINRGESRSAVADVVLGKITGYDEAVEEAQIPKVYEGVHKHYFGEVKKILDDARNDSDNDSDS